MPSAKTSDNPARGFLDMAASSKLGPRLRHPWWLVELMAKGLREKDFASIPPYVEDTGEVNWLVQAAIDKEIAMPITALSVMSLFQSRGSGQDSNRAVALLRHGYGGHPLGKDQAVARERKTSRITKL
jgi:6-phosphogluconate dehydrogenase